jgi:hypothetical protein
MVRTVIKHSRSIAFLLLTLAVGTRSMAQSCPGVLPSFQWVAQGTAITFTNATDDPYGLIDSVNWDFGDFNLAWDQWSADHTFASTGTHTVRMHAWANNGLCVFTAEALVAHGDGDDECTAVISPEYSWFQPSNNVVSYTNGFSSSGVALTSIWDLGDGSPLYPGDSPTHAYGLPGRYTVTLSAAGQDSSTLDGCVAGIVKTVLVDGNASTCDSSLFVDLFLLDLGGGAVQAEGTVLALTSSLLADSVSWSFGDLVSGYGDQLSVIHVYSHPGTYQVCLNALAHDTAPPDTCYAVCCHTFSSAALDIVEPMQYLDLNAWPNPFTEQLHLGTSIPAEGRWAVSVMDLTGREVHRSEIPAASDVEVPLGHLSPGAYVLQAITLQGRYRSVVIKR